MNPWQRTIVILSLVITGITGCVCAETKVANDVAQIIVKFKDSATDPANASLLKSLAQTSKLKVRHVRPMSGGAQIYVLSGVDDQVLVSEAIKQISARPDVEYAELDRKLIPQKNKPNGNQ